MKISMENLKKKINEVLRNFKSELENKVAKKHK